MKLISLYIHKAETCGGLLDGLFVPFREDAIVSSLFDPLCIIGPNGSGKSQLLQVIAEIFQLVFWTFLPHEERGAPNDSLQFEIEYLMSGKIAIKETDRVKISKLESDLNPNGDIQLEVFRGDRWVAVTDGNIIASLLPKKIIGYTSGDNETLSLPFFSSRAGYAEEVGNSALDPSKKDKHIPDPRLLLIDYGTNLEVLVANLLLNPDDVKARLLEQPNLRSLTSFRCVIQLNHSAVRHKDGVKLTTELENYVEYLKRCATCFDYDEKRKVYILDFFVTNATYDSFAFFWDGALELYSCFHKLAMLNDLVIPKKAREVFEKSIKNRRFSARLPEPFDLDKVFRFERVEFVSKKDEQVVDYVSLSDGEHQLAQLLGTASMISFPDALFLLDEPESHFNPKWRVEFISKLLEQPTAGGTRFAKCPAAEQECIITTHSPFMPSDMKRENVLIFSKLEADKTLAVRRPRAETYGSTFDSILQDCFEISPPMSDLPRKDIERLMVSDDSDAIKKKMETLGDSVEKLFLADRVRQLELARSR
jgi:restriction system-associated AAA family ATPase